MQQNEPPNRYQIPSCSICHQLLKQQLHSLSCGHVFHYLCITQQFQYKGVCPNCQKKANERQLRKIVFPLYPIGSSADREVDRILKCLDHTEKNQFNVIIDQMKKATQAREKAQRQCSDLQTIKSKQQIEIKNLKSKHQNAQKQLQLTKRERHQLKTRFNELQDKKYHMNKQLNSALQSLDFYREKQAKFKRFEQAQEFVKKSSNEIVQMKAQLEAQQTDPQKIAQTFYQMALIKNNEIRKWKEKSKDLPSKIEGLKNQIQRQKDNTAKYRNECDRMRVQKQKYKQKYDQLKAHYKQLKERSRKEGNEDIDDELLGFSGNSWKNINPLATVDPIEQIPVVLAQKKTPSAQFGGYGGIAKKKNDSVTTNKMISSFGGFSVGLKK